MPQHLDSVPRGKVRRERGIVGRHDRAGGAFRKAGEAPNVIPLRLGEASEQGLLLPRRQVIEEVGPVVRAHRGDYFCQLTRSEKPGHGHLSVRTQVTEYLGATPKRGRKQVLQRRFRPDLLEIRRQINGMSGFDEISNRFLIRSVETRNRV